MHRLSLNRFAALAASAAVILPISALATPAHATTVAALCTRYVAPGAPAGDGASAANPMSLPNLVAFVNAAPRPGLVACLSGGAYGTPTTEFNLKRGGNVGNAVSIIKDPASDTDPVITGRLVVSRGADNVVLANLHFVGPGSGNPSAFSIDANNVELTGNDMSSPNRICISIGGGIRTVTPAPPRVTGFIADGNKVHDCGTNRAKTGSPQSHAFYVEYTSGAIIRNNIIRNPVGRGVQLFNDADNSIVENNIFDGNFAAVNFGGGTPGSASVDPRSENNVVQNNIVTNGVKWCNTNNQCQHALFVQGNHEAAYANPPSTDPQTKAGATWGNVVRSNCVYFPDSSVAVAYNDWEPGYRYETTTNKAIDPLYNNAPAGDFRLKPSSPCLGKGIRPSMTATNVSPSSTSVAATATLRSPWMTATYRMQVRTCGAAVTSVADKTSCDGAWTLSTSGSVAGTDVNASRTISGLRAGQIYEYRWVTWQALQAAPAATVNYTSTTQYWTASAAMKFKTLA